MARTKHKALIGCPIYPADDMYLDGYIASICAQDYGRFDIIFAETSGNDDFLGVLKKTGAIAIPAEPKKERMERIIAGREAIRQYFLEHDYDFLWFVDADIRPGKNALSKLVNSGKDVISGVCLSPFTVDGVRRVLPCLYKFGKKKGVCQQLNRQQASGSGIEEIAVAGFGCVLIARRVLKKISIRRFAEGGGEDAAFFIDSLRAGFKNFVNKDVKCSHLVYPPDDLRNKEFEFSAQ